MVPGYSAFPGQRAKLALLALFAVCALSLAFATTAPAAWTPVDPVDGSFDWLGSFDAGLDANGAAQDIWAGETDSGGIDQFSTDGQSLVNSFTVEYTFASGELSGVDGIAIDPAGEMLYVADQDNHRVVGLNVVGGMQSAELQAPGGTPTECPGVDCPTSSTAAGAFRFPSVIALHDGEVFVLDDNLRIQVFDDQLGYLRTITNPVWDYETEGSGGPEPETFTINPANGNLLVAMSGGAGIEEYTPAGAFVRVIPSPVTWPSAIAIDHLSNVVYLSDGGSIYTLDYTTGQVLGIAADLAGNQWVMSLEVQPQERILLVGYGEDLGDESYTTGIARYAYDGPPTCAAAAAAAQGTAPLSFSLSCTDTSAAPQVTYELLSQPTNGTISGFNSATGALTYTAANNASSSDSFTYRARSLTGVSQTYTATVTVGEAVPVIRSTANLERSSGDIFVKLPGTDSWVKLEKNALVPIGTIIDAANGYCVLTFANADGSFYEGTFWGGVFQILQGDGAEPYAILKLRDDEFPGAPSQAAAAASASSVRGRSASVSKAKSKASAKKGKKKNKLWGKGKGKFRTSGDGSSASVRGTRWGVTNYANGTVTQVTSGVVVVRDFYRKKNITLRRGQSYFADKNWKRSRATARAKPRFTG